MAIVNDTGFVADPHEFDFQSPAPGIAHWDLDGALSLDQLPDGFETKAALRIIFSGYADGRGFTLAAQLRRAGFQGHLRAHGPLVADQYAMARRSGFDDVEIPDEIAARQSQDQWLARANWQANDYQSRLRGLAQSAASL